LAKLSTNKKSKGTNLGFEVTLWQTADKLRGHLDTAEYKSVVLGLVFLKYISDDFGKTHAQLSAQRSQGANPEDRDEYIVERVFYEGVRSGGESFHRTD